MALKLQGRWEFTPLLLRKVLPNRPQYHEYSVVTMAQYIGWPIKKTRNFWK